MVTERAYVIKGGRFVPREGEPPPKGNVVVRKLDVAHVSLGPGGMTIGGSSAEKPVGETGKLTYDQGFRDGVGEAGEMYERLTKAGVGGEQRPIARWFTTREGRRVPIRVGPAGIGGELPTEAPITEEGVGGREMRGEVRGAEVSLLPMPTKDDLDAAVGDVDWSAICRAHNWTVAGILYGRGVSSEELADTFDEVFELDDEGKLKLKAAGEELRIEVSGVTVGRPETPEETQERAAIDAMYEAELGPDDETPATGDLALHVDNGSVSICAVTRTEGGGVTLDELDLQGAPQEVLRELRTLAVDLFDAPMEQVLLGHAFLRNRALPPVLAGYMRERHDIGAMPQPEAP